MSLPAMRLWYINFGANTHKKAAFQDSKPGSSRSYSPLSRLRWKSNTDIFHGFLKIKNRPLPKLSKLSPLFAAGHVGVITEHKMCVEGKAEGMLLELRQTIAGRHSQRKLANDRVEPDLPIQPTGDVLIPRLDQRQKAHLLSNDNETLENFCTNVFCTMAQQSHVTSAFKLAPC